MTLHRFLFPLLLGFFSHLQSTKNQNFFVPISKVTVQMPRARGRPRAPRLSRMDAAVDAMLPYGFPEGRVKKCVKELLKEYGGDEGWPFIEDCSYSVLLNVLLDARDNQEHVAQNGDLLEGASCGDGASNGDIVPSDICNDPVPSAEESRNDGRVVLAESASVDSVDLVVPLAANRGSGRRVPCYGWIESDEEDGDADDFIVLTPCRGIGGVPTTLRKKRRSRWDVKPLDAS